jgi:hydroxymethylglutaryl-CoA lyase
MNFPVVQPVETETKPNYPSKVSVYEVGPRDGLQNEKTIISVDDKVRFITGLFDAGLTKVETTSFVSPKWIPQLADASQLLQALPAEIATTSPVLVPNLKGMQRAIDCSVTHIAIFASATEAFAKNNLNSTYQDQFIPMKQVADLAHKENMKIRGYVSMCFGDPWEGQVAASKVVETVKQLLELGVYEVSLGDTIGVATPGQVQSLLGLLFAAGISPTQLAVHFHDTYGQALSNTLMALQMGISTVDSSAGGIGGCPYALNASGNLATEDLVWMLDGMGIETGVNLTELIKVSTWMTTVLGRPSTSRVLKALSGL